MKRRDLCIEIKRDIYREKKREVLNIKIDT